MNDIRKGPNAVIRTALVGRTRPFVERDQVDLDRNIMALNVVDQSMCGTTRAPTLISFNWMVDSDHFFIFSGSSMLRRIAVKL